MTHINEKIAEFVFQDLSAQEMAEARIHVAECSACREQVAQFQSTYAMLKTSPDVEPPRRILFEFEKPVVASWIWRWLAPMAASAAVALAVVHFAPQPQPQIVERVIQQPAAQPAAQPVDYQKIIDELRASQEVWLANELKKRDSANGQEIRRLHSEVAALDYYQRKIERENWDTARDVQLLAAKTDRE